MRKVIQKGKAVAAVLVLGGILSVTTAQATSKEFNEYQRIDSNSWTQIASASKSSNYSYAAFYLRKMWKTDGSKQTQHGPLAENYKYLLGRMSTGGTTIIEKKVGGGGSYSKGVATLEKGTKSIYLVKKNYRAKGIKVNIFLQGHDPRLDCFASGSWNIDRANAEL